ncbi:MAG: hypothetical protein PHS04_18350, partial [Tissierellia bacterium]|nr:hypothetical protein [Tissierellia bacterium]
MSKKLFGTIAGLMLALAVMVAPVVDAEELSLDSMSTEQLIALIQQLLAGSTTTTTPTTTTGTSSTAISGIPADFQFNTNLKLGMTGNDVKYLQIVLNSDSATAVATSGVGSAGNESTYFGAMTKAAVVKFQNKYASTTLTPLGLTSGTGFVGAATRTQLNTLLAAGTSTPVSNLPAGCTSTTGYSSTTGVACSTVSTLPTGCTSTTGFSPVTGQSCAGGTTTPVVTPVTGSGMTVALASDSPSNTTLVTGQSAAPLAKFVITNSDSVTATITKVELSRIGVSADSTLANVYLFNGETRLTDAATVNQGVVSFNSGSGLFTIPAGQSMVVTVASDIASSTSGQIVGVSLTGITSNVEVKSTLPLQAATQTIAAATLADYTFVTTTGTANIDPADDVVVWQSTVTAGTRDIKVSKLALKQISSIDSDDVENFRLFVNGTEVAQVASLDANNMVTFTFDYTLTGTKTFKVLADIKGGSSRTLQMSLRNKADF